MESGRWRARPWTAASLRALSTVVPMTLALVGTALLAPVLAGPDGVPAVVAWAVTAVAFGAGAVLLRSRLRRWLGPLSFLLRLSLVFPGPAAPRVALALAAAQRRWLHDRIDAVTRDGLPEDPVASAWTVVSLVAALNAHHPEFQGRAELRYRTAAMVAARVDLPEVDRQRLHWRSLLGDVARATSPVAAAAMAADNYGNEPTAAILQLADTWATLTAPRPHGSGFSRADALDALRDGAGRHLEPGVLRIFLAGERSRRPWHLSS